MQGFLVFRVEAMPEGDVACSFSDSARVDEGFGKGVELPVVVDDIGFVIHALPGILISNFYQLLFGALAFDGGVDVLFAQVIAEVVPVAVDVPWQGLPDVALRAVDISDDFLHFLEVGEPALIRQFFVLLQEVLDWEFDLAGEMRREFGSHGWHGGGTSHWSVCHGGCRWQVEWQS